MDGININSTEKDYALLIAKGLKTIETRNTNSLKSKIGQRVYIIRTGLGCAQIIGSVEISKVIIYQTAKDFSKDFRKHLVSKKSKYYIQKSKVKYGYVLVNPILFDTFYKAPKGGIVIRKNIKEI